MGKIRTTIKHRYLGVSYARAFESWSYWRRGH